MRIWRSIRRIYIDCMPAGRFNDRDAGLQQTFAR
jgi:hypothetical protein